MTFTTISDLNRFSDNNNHFCLDVSTKKKQEFVMIVLKGEQFMYFSEVSPDGMLGKRTYQLIMVASRNLGKEN